MATGVETGVGQLLDLFTRMARIRAFETKVQELFKRAALPGFVHLYVGEEAVAVGACSALRDDRPDHEHAPRARPPDREGRPTSAA